MRYKFALEGKQTIIPNMLKPGSLQWEEGGSLPVTFGNDFSDPSKIIGVARDLRREDEGWLTADIEWNEHMTESLKEMLTADEAFVTIYAADLVDSFEGEGDDRVRVVEKATLRALYVVADEPDPWTVVEPDDV